MRKKTEMPERRIRRASTPEARENQMIALAMDLVEQRLLEGTASSQETTHFLKLGTAKEMLEREKLEKENELLKAKTEAIKTAEKIEELYENAINAMKAYSGCIDEQEESYEEDDDEDIY